MLDQFALFASAVGSVLSLNRDAIRELQLAPGGLSVAIWILLVGTLSDVLGNSPVLFINHMRRGRFALALGLEFVLSVIRLAIWLVSFWILVDWLRPAGAALDNIALVVGLGYAPMLLSFLVVVPFVGPLFGRIVHVWTLAAILVSIAVATNTTLLANLGPALIVIVVILAVRRWSDFVTTSVLGSISSRVLGIDVMQRTRAMDPRQVVSAPG